MSQTQQAPFVRTPQPNWARGKSGGSASTTKDFLLPAVGGSSYLFLDDTGWVSVGQYLLLATATLTAYLKVLSVATGTVQVEVATIEGGASDGSLFELGSGVRVASRPPMASTAMTIDAIDRLPDEATVQGALAMLALGWVNVKAFGAIGDGVANDTTAIKAAYNFLTSRGGTVYFPEGVYLFNENLSLPAGVRMVGAGFSQQRLNGGLGIKRPTSLKKSGNITGITLNECCGLENLSVDGDAGNLGDGVNLKGARTWAKNVGVFEMGGIGIVVSDDANSFHLENTTSGWNTSHGYYIHSATNNANIGYVANNLAWTNGGDGWRVNQSFETAFAGNYAESNTGYGFRVMTLARFQNYLGCGGEANGTPFVFEAGSQNNAFFGASNLYLPTDNGANSVMVAQGGEVGRRGWNAPGAMRVGVNPSANGAFQTVNGFGAHGPLPGFYFYDTAGGANSKCWEIFCNSPLMSWRTINDDGSGALDFLNITRHGTYVDFALHPLSIFYASRMRIGGGAEITKVLSAQADLDFPSIPAHDFADLTIAVPGANVGDVVALGVNLVLGGIVHTAFVSATDTVLVRAHNVIGGAQDPASTGVRVAVMKFA